VIIAHVPLFSLLDFSFQYNKWDNTLTSRCQLWSYDNHDSTRDFPNALLLRFIKNSCFLSNGPHSPSILPLAGNDYPRRVVLNFILQWTFAHGKHESLSLAQYFKLRETCFVGSQSCSSNLILNSSWIRHDLAKEGKRLGDLGISFGGNRINRSYQWGDQSYLEILSMSCWMSAQRLCPNIFNGLFQVSWNTLNLARRRFWVLARCGRFLCVSWRWRFDLCNRRYSTCMRNSFRNIIIDFEMRLSEGMDHWLIYTWVW